MWGKVWEIKCSHLLQPSCWLPLPTYLFVATSLCLVCSASSVTCPPSNTVGLSFPESRSSQPLVAPHVRRAESCRGQPTVSTKDWGKSMFNFPGLKVTSLCHSFVITKADVDSMYMKGQSFIPVKLFFFFYKNRQWAYHTPPSFAFLLNKSRFIL